MGRGGYGDGGVVCSAADLVKYGSYWLNDDPGPLALSAAAKREMITPAVVQKRLSRTLFCVFHVFRLFLGVS